IKKLTVFLIISWTQLTEKMGFMKMPPSASSSWSAQPAASTATKKLKEKAPHMREKKRKRSQREA
ncbi:hypothetical protein N1Z97_RS27595, partial [Escherichia coli]